MRIYKLRICTIGFGLLLGSASARATEMPSLKFGLNFQAVATAFDLTPKNDPAKKLTYRPAMSNYAGVILGYKWIGGTVSFAVPASQDIRAEEGESRYQDYRLSLYFRRFGVELSYNRYAGYLIENSATLSAATLAGQTYYKLPDLSTLGYGANFIYVLNPETYSLPAALDQSEIQEKSAGSWVLVGTFRNQTISSTSPIIPDEKKADYGTDQGFQSADTSSYAAGIGYTFNWVPGPFFVAPMLALSMGYQRCSYIVDNTAHDYQSVGVNAHGRIGIGINSRKIFLAFGLYMDSFGQTTETLRIGNTTYGTSLSMGLRL